MTWLVVLLQDPWRRRKIKRLLCDCYKVKMYFSDSLNIWCI
jgi:hypothetical protein